MKSNLNLYVVATIFASLLFSSCKYEDGPSLSLRTKKARLTGEWEVQFIDGESATEDGLEITLEFEKDGDFEYTLNSPFFGRSTVSGEWEWEDGKQSIEITIDGSKEEWEITRLTNKEFEFEDEDNDKWELEKQ